MLKHFYNLPFLNVTEKLFSFELKRFQFSKSAKTNFRENQTDTTIQKITDLFTDLPHCCCLVTYLFLQKHDLISKYYAN